MKIQIRTNKTIRLVEVIKFIKFTKLNVLFAIHKAYNNNLEYTLTDIVSGFSLPTRTCYSEQGAIDNSISNLFKYDWNNTNYIEKRDNLLKKLHLSPMEININIPIRVHYYNRCGNKVTVKTINYKPL